MPFKIPLGELFVKLTGDSTAFDRMIKRARASVKKAATTMMAAGAALSAPLIALGVKSVNALRVQIRAEQQLTQALKSTRHAAGMTFEELTKLASSLQRVTNFGDEATIRMEAILLTFTKIGRQVLPQTIESVMNVASALGTDLKAAAIQIGKALNDPAVGMSMLSRSGITFTKEQQKVIKALVASNRLLDAQKLILRELETQFGGAARAVADPIIQIQNLIGDVMEELGRELLPTVHKVVTVIEDWVRKWRGLSAETRTLIVQIAAVVAAVGSSLLVFGLTLHLIAAMTTGFGFLLTAFGIVAIAAALVTDAFREMTNTGSMGILDLVNNWRIGTQKISTLTQGMWLEIMNDTDRAAAGWKFIWEGFPLIAQGALLRVTDFYLQFIRKMTRLTFQLADFLSFKLLSGRIKSLAAAADTFFTRQIIKTLEKQTELYKTYYDTINRLDQTAKTKIANRNTAIAKIFRKDEAERLKALGAQKRMEELLAKIPKVPEFEVPDVTKQLGKAQMKLATQFQEISLRRFALEGPGGLAQKVQEVKVPGVESKLDELIEVTKRQDQTAKLG
jgi:hypothetical protein